MDKGALTWKQWLFAAGVAILLGLWAAWLLWVLTLWMG